MHAQNIHRQYECYGRIITCESNIDDSPYRDSLYFGTAYSSDSNMPQLFASPLKDATDSSTFATLSGESISNLHDFIQAPTERLLSLDAEGYVGYFEDNEAIETHLAAYPLLVSWYSVGDRHALNIQFHVEPMIGAEVFLTPSQTVDFNTHTETFQSKTTPQHTPTVNSSGDVEKVLIR